MLISELPINDRCCFEYVVNNLPIEFKDIPIVRGELVQLSDVWSYFIDLQESDINTIVSKCIVVIRITDIEKLLNIFSNFFIVDQKFYVTDRWCDSQYATHTCLILEPNYG